MTDTRVLDLLLKADEALSLEELSRRLGTPSAKVRAMLTELSDAGCELEEHPGRGVRLIRSGLGVWVDYLHARDGTTQRRIELYQSTASTQDAVRKIIERIGPKAHGALVIADEQSAGRGRLGRKWFSPPGAAVTFSRACVSDAMTIDRMTLATAVAAAESVATLTGIDVQIKWPNDLSVDGRKLAGILVEAFQGPTGPAAVIGVGVNVHLERDQLPDEPNLRDSVTSLAMLGRPVNRLLLLAELVRRMDAALDSESDESLLAAWRRRSALLGKHVRVQTDGTTVEGDVVDLDPQDGLILRTHDGALLHLHGRTSTVL